MTSVVTDVTAWFEFLATFEITRWTEIVVTAMLLDRWMVTLGW